MDALIFKEFEDGLQHNNIIVRVEELRYRKKKARDRFGVVHEQDKNNFSGMKTLLATEIHITDMMLHAYELVQELDFWQSGKAREDYDSQTIRLRMKKLKSGIKHILRKAENLAKATNNKRKHREN